MLKAWHLGPCMLIGPLINAYCLVSPIRWSHSASPDWTQGRSLATKNSATSFIYFYFFQACRMEKLLSRKNVLWRNKVSVIDSDWFSSLRQEHFDVYCMSVSISIYVNLQCKLQFFHGGTGCTPTVSCLLLLLPPLLLLLPSNIQYFIVQLCSGAEQKSAFHLISSRHTSMWVCWCVCVYTLVSLKCIVANHFVEYLGRFFCLFVFLCYCWVWFFGAPKCNGATSSSKHLHVAPFQIILLFWKIETKKEKWEFCVSGSKVIYRNGSF